MESLRRKKGGKLVPFILPSSLSTLEELLKAAPSSSCEGPFLKATVRKLAYQINSSHSPHFPPRPCVLLVPRREEKRKKRNTQINCLDLGWGEGKSEKANKLNELGGGCGGENDSSLDKQSTSE